jgi:hypothetical protein
MLPNRLHDPRMRVPQRIHPQPRNKIEIAPVLQVVKKYALPPCQHNGIPVVSPQQIPPLQLRNLFECFHRKIRFYRNETLEGGPSGMRAVARRNAYDQAPFSRARMLYCARMHRIGHKLRRVTVDALLIVSLLTSIKLCLSQTTNQNSLAVVPHKPVPSLQDLEKEDAVIDNPILPYSFPSGEIPFVFDSPPEMFRPAVAGQQAESMDLALREMVKRGASENEIRTALDKMARWARRVTALRDQYYRGGPAACDALSARNPNDAHLAARCARRWLYELEKERDVLMVKIPPGFRNIDTGQVCVDPGNNSWQRTDGVVKSTAFPHIQRDVQRALAGNPNDGEALVAALLQQFRTCRGDPVPYAQTAARMSEPVTYIARAYLGMRDSRTPSIGSEIASLRTSSCSSNNVKGADGHEYIQTKCDIPPSPDRLRRADQLEAESNRITAENNAYERAAESAFWDPDVVWMFAAKPIRRRKEHLAHYALFFDPSDFRLHELRSEAWGQGADEHKTPYFWKLFLSSDYSEWSFRRGDPNDYGSCSGMYEELRAKYNDPFTEYIVGDYCMRMEPTHPAGHSRIGYSLFWLSQKNMAGITLPNAMEQAQLENEVAYQVGARLMQHHEEWRPTDTRETITTWMGRSKFQRGETLRLLGQYALARKCYDQALQSGYNSDEIKKAIARLPH